MVSVHWKSNIVVHLGSGRFGGAPGPQHATIEAAAVDKREYATYDHKLPSREIKEDSGRGAGERKWRLRRLAGARDRSILGSANRVLHKPKINIGSCRIL